MQDFILILALLNTESSYKSEIERPMSHIQDTAQFWLGAQEPWRIRTYAIDHDIHIYSLGSRKDGTSLTQKEATDHIAKHYKDVLQKQYVIKFKDPNDPIEVAHTLKKNGLLGALEVAPAGFAFYNPDGQRYKTQSSPQ